MYDYIFRYTLAGDYSTGKSSIVNRFLHDRYSDRYDVTIGVEFGSKSINVKNNEIKLQLWDTAGQERFRSVCYSYFKNNTCIVLVFDITNKASFLNLKYWVDHIKNFININTLVCVISTKHDLGTRCIENDEIDEFISENNLIYYECSSKNDMNIDKIFYNTAEIILNKINNKIINENEFHSLGIRLSPISEQLLIPKVKEKKPNDCCTIF